MEKKCAMQIPLKLKLIETNKDPNKYENKHLNKHFPKEDIGIISS